MPWQDPFVLWASSGCVFQVKCQLFLSKPFHEIHERTWVVSAYLKEFVQQSSGNTLSSDYQLSHNACLAAVHTSNLPAVTATRVIYVRASATA